MKLSISLFLLAFLPLLTTLSCAQMDNTQETISLGNHQPEPGVSLDTATLGAGCFWCVEAIYQRLEGVYAVESGYAGGKVINPSYKAVCSGTTGHAEVIQLTYDPAKVSFGDLLEVFWRTHDPTTLNRQGNDVGTQYRSVIFYHNEEQKSIAEISMAAAEEAEIWPDPIVTEVSPLNNYSKAENYHQNYFNDNKSQSYCTYVIGPKVAKFQKLFKEKLKH